MVFAPARHEVASARRVTRRSSARGAWLELVHAWGKSLPSASPRRQAARTYAFARTHCACS
eukprot:2856256-Alexandrium_andersonii.AAC.1